MSKAHILLVEDEESLLFGIRDLLEIEKYHVSMATDGRKALEVLRDLNYRPDLIISDIRMPNMDGYQFLDEVRKVPDWVQIPFIFLSAKGQKDDIHNGRLRGAADYLTKPFDFKDLLVSVQSCLMVYSGINAAQESRMESLRRTILTMINHEFRTPLSYIVSYADMMSTNETFEHDEELRQYIDGITQGSERLLRLIQSFLMLAEMESGHALDIYRRRKSVVENPENLLTEAVAATHDAAKAWGVTVEVAVETSPPILGDREYLKSAVKHLVDNAIKFSPRKSNAIVKCKASVVDGMLLYQVWDQGRGLPEDPKERERIFEMFYQFNRVEFEQQGIGAGLAIVRHVAMMHGGRVHVDSQEGIGSCFTMQLPLAPG